MDKLGRNQFQDDDRRPPDIPSVNSCNPIILMANFLKKIAMEWFKTNWRQAIILTLISVVLTTIGSLIVLGVALRGEQVRGAASVNYVDEHINKLDVRVTKVENDLDLKADKVDITRVEAKIDNIYNLLIEMNKK